MMNVIARLQLYKGKNKRQTAFKSGYRPLFELNENIKTSGMITLLDRGELLPGESAVVLIKFLLNDCRIDFCSYFYEGKEPLGEIMIIEVKYLNLIMNK